MDATTDDHNEDTTTIDKTIASLKRRLEEADDTIFELSAELATVSKTAEYQMQQTKLQYERNSQTLEHQLRLMQQTTNQLRLQQQRRVTRSPVPSDAPPRIIAPPQPPQQQWQTVPTQSQQLVPKLLSHSANDELYRSFLVSLLLLSDNSSSSSSSDHSDTTILVWWVTNINNTKNTIPDDFVYFLQHSPRACRTLLTGTEGGLSTATSSIQNLDSNMQRLLWQLEGRLEDPYTPTTTTATTAAPTTRPTSRAQQQLYSNFLRLLQEKWDDVNALRSLTLLVASYQYPLLEPYMDTLVNRWSHAVRNATTTNNNVAWRVMRHHDNSDTPNQQPPSMVWMTTALALLRHNLLQQQTEEWYTSKRASTVLAACLDVLEHYDITIMASSLHVECVLFLQVLVQQDFKLLLLVQIPTAHSTAQVWHRAPTACEVLGELLWKLLPQQQQYQSLRDAVIRTFQMILNSIEDDRKRDDESNKPSLYFIDVLGTAREYFMAAAHRIVQNNDGDKSITDMLTVQLEELALDQAEKFAD